MCVCARAEAVHLMLLGESLTVDCQQDGRGLADADRVLGHTNVSSLVAGRQFGDDQVAARLHSDPVWLFKMVCAVEPAGPDHPPNE